MYAAKQSVARSAQPGNRTTLPPWDDTLMHYQVRLKKATNSLAVNCMYSLNATTYRNRPSEKVKYALLESRRGKE